MKQIFEVTDKKVISQVLNKAEYGTLAVCSENRPYSVPINFVEFGGDIYFHGGKNGRKMSILKENQFASFSVVESYSLLPSYFSSNDELSCSGTHFFKSIIVDGKIEFIDEYEKKVEVLDKLMQKLQPEGKYKPHNENIYKKIIDATVIYKLVSEKTKAKFKFGQQLNKEKFDLVIKNLEIRGTDKDIETLELMKSLKID